MATTNSNTNYKSVKLWFGHGILINLESLRSLLGAIKATINRELTPAEMSELYSYINRVYKNDLDAKKVKWEILGAVEPFEESMTIASDSQLSFAGELTESVKLQIKIKKVSPDGARVLQEWAKYEATLGVVNQMTQPNDESLRSLNANGSLLRFKKEAWHNLVPALEAVARFSGRVEKWINLFNKNAYLAFQDMSDEEKCSEKVLLPTGMQLKNSSRFQDEYKSRSSISLLLQRSLDNREYDIKIVIDNDIENPKRLSDCVPIIYQKVARPALKRALGALANMAEEEDWSYHGKIFDALEYYIEAVFDQLIKDDDSYSNCSNNPGGKWRAFAHPNKDPESLVFNTGLVSRRDSHYIYGYCSNKEDGVYQKVSWETNCTDASGKTLPNPNLVSGGENERHHGMPLPPNWIGSPSRLLFDYKYGSYREREIDFLLPHIYDNLIDHHDNRLPKKQREHFLHMFPVYDKERFEEFIYAAWRRTRKDLQKSYKVAIPTYYNGQIQLLVPLYLDDRFPNDVSVALVVTINEDTKKQCHYFCPTVLSLDMARVDSRVITRIDGTWLSDNKNQK